MYHQNIYPSNATDMPYKQIRLAYVQIGDTYVSIYTSHELNAINNVTTNTGIHMFHITLCLSTNIPHNAHIYPIALLL